MCFNVNLETKTWIVKKKTHFSLKKKMYQWNGYWNGWRTILIDDFRYKGQSTKWLKKKLNVVDITNKRRPYSFTVLSILRGSILRYRQSSVECGKSSNGCFWVFFEDTLVKLFDRGEKEKRQKKRNFGIYRRSDLSTTTRCLNSSHRNFYLFF